MKTTSPFLFITTIAACLIAMATASGVTTRPGQGLRPYGSVGVDQRVAGQGFGHAAIPGGRGFQGFSDGYGISGSHYGLGRPMMGPIALPRGAGFEGFAAGFNIIAIEPGLQRVDRHRFQQGGAKSTAEFSAPPQTSGELPSAAWWRLGGDFQPVTPR